MSDSNETHGIGFDGPAGLGIFSLVVLVPAGMAAGVAAFLASWWVGELPASQALAIGVTTTVLSVGNYLCTTAWAFRQLKKHPISFDNPRRPRTLFISSGWFLTVLTVLPSTLGTLLYGVSLVTAAVASVSTLVLSFLIGTLLSFATARVFTALAKRAAASVETDQPGP